MDTYKDIAGLTFNSNPSTIMHIDFNSCFATVEQQANPHLRGKPIAVAAYATPSGCIIAPSIEAKKTGVSVGMRVKDGKSICPNLIILEPDPDKYRNIHIALRKIVSDYTNDFFPKSIDEFVLDLEDFLLLPCREHPLKVVAQQCKSGSPSRGKFAWPSRESKFGAIQQVAQEIKIRIKQEIGEWLTVSVGIGPNRFLAKLAAGLNKPDGLDEINKNNFESVFRNLSLTDLCGIKIRNVVRLNNVGIFSVMDFYKAPLWRLKAAFQSILGYYWYLRLRGWEIDDVEFSRRSYGNSYALPKPLQVPEELSPILTKLVEKMGTRLRRAGYKARGVHLSILYRDWSHWHKGVTFENELFDSRDIYKKAFWILTMSPCQKPVRKLAVSVFDLIESKSSQLELFNDIDKKERLTKHVDQANERWGDFVVTPARMLMAEKNAVPDRIAFGGVKELEEFVIRG